MNKQKETYTVKRDAIKKPAGRVRGLIVPIEEIIQREVEA